MTDIARTCAGLDTDLISACERELLEHFRGLPENVTDITLNSDGECGYDTNDGKTGRMRIKAEERDLMRIATVLAGAAGQSLNERSPSLSCVLPMSGYRIEALIPPVVERACLAIRIPNSAFFSLESLRAKGMLTRHQTETLRDMIKGRMNIAISGQTGSGKTTLLCALINEISAKERLIVIEEGAREVSLNRRDTVFITARKGVFSGRDAVRSALRMNPDRIIYGETRDGESALEMLKAFRTGHSGGLFTIHASSARQAIRRLSDLLFEVAASYADNLVADTIDAVAHLDFSEDGKRIVKEIVPLRD